MKAPEGFLGEGEPRELAGIGREPPVLALHGFGGTPQEIELAVEVARKYRLRYHAPLLPGHGTTVEELAQCKYADWLSAAQAALRALTDRGPALVAGISMGSLLALQLAATFPDKVLGVAVLANAATLSWPFPAWGLAAVSGLGLRNFNVLKPWSDIADPIERRRHLTYKAQPTAAAVEVWRAGPNVRALLPDVRAPLLILHGERDRICPVNNANLVAREVGSQDVRVVVLPRSRHIVTRDVERPVVHRELSEFFGRFVSDAPTLA